MSRVGKMPIAVPQGVDVSITAEQISVKGAQGTLVRRLNPLVAVNAVEAMCRPFAATEYRESHSTGPHSPEDLGRLFPAPAIAAASSAENT